MIGALWLVFTYLAISLFGIVDNLYDSRIDAQVDFVHARPEFGGDF